MGDPGGGAGTLPGGQSAASSGELSPFATAVIAGVNQYNLQTNFAKLAGYTTSIAVSVGPGIARASGIYLFGRLGPQWHFGLEGANYHNILHIGRHATYGVHVAFGSVAPYVANHHVYFERAFPFFRYWRP
jgi:hypothetical protein